MHLSTTIQSPNTSSSQELSIDVGGGSSTNLTSPALSPRMSTTVKYKFDDANTSKSVTTSIKTPHSSSVKSRESDILLSIDTCLGTLHISKIRLFSVASLVINLSAFIILASLIIASFVLQTEFNELWDNLDTDTTAYRQYSISAARSAVFSGNDLAITQEYSKIYTDYLLKFSNSSARFRSLVPESVSKAALNGKTSSQLDTTKAILAEQGAIANAKNGNFAAAMNSLNSDQYHRQLESYSSEFQVMVDYVAAMKKNSQYVSTIVLSISLAVICLSLFMVIPVIVSSFVASVKKDASNTRKLNQVRAFLLMDTMDNPNLRELFRKFCQTELSIENFQILEKISDYKLLCEKSFEIQEYLLDSDSSENSDTDAKKKKKKYHEKDLYDIEKKKYEIAFEIYTDYLDVRGDKSVNLAKHMTDKVKNHLDLFATGQNEHLIDSLFDDVGSEICILMLDTHHRFKQTMVFEKQARKEAMRVKVK